MYSEIRISGNPECSRREMTEEHPGTFRPLRGRPYNKNQLPFFLDFQYGLSSQICLVVGKDFKTFLSGNFGEKFYCLQFSLRERVKNVVAEGERHSLVSL